MNTERVHRDYGQQRVPGQRLRFAAWAKRTVKSLIPVAPQIARDIDLSIVRDCDQLWIHYEAKLAPEVAALEIAGGRWR